MGIDLTKATDQKNDFAAIPDGTYAVTIIESELKKSASGGEYVKVTLKVKDTRYEGIMFSEMFTTVNRNPEAVEIGLSQLKNLFTITGTTVPTDFVASSLKGLNFTVKTKTQTSEAYPQPQTRVKTWMPATPKPTSPSDMF